MGRLIFKLFLAFFGLLLMLGVFVFGVTIRDTRRWYLLPLIHTTLQPSEIARTALVFFLAYWATRTGRDFRSFKRGFAPAAAAIAGDAALGGDVEAQAHAPAGGSSP